MLGTGYFFALAISIVAVALSGIATDRHFIVIMLAIELIFVASSLVVVSAFSYNAPANPGALVMLLSIWTVATVEIITLVTFYVYMRHKGIDFDVTKLAKLKG